MKARFLTRRQQRKLRKRIKRETDKFLTALMEKRENAPAIVLPPDFMETVKRDFAEIAEKSREMVKKLAPLGVAMAASMADSAEAEGGDDNGEENNADC